MLEQTTGKQEQITANKLFDFVRERYWPAVESSGRLISLVCGEPCKGSRIVGIRGQDGQLEHRAVD
jgi:hypothetical protein